jgi:hypothetical protein
MLLPWGESRDVISIYGDKIRTVYAEMRLYPDVELIAPVSAVYHASFLDY